MTVTKRRFFEIVLFSITFVISLLNVLLVFTFSFPLEIRLLYLVTMSISSVVMLYSVLRKSSVRRSLHVAVIGFSRSGKTTLITSLFGEAFARRLPINLNPRGSQTIERINKSLELLQKGKALGPTKDQDMFAFRADTTIGAFPFKTTYQIEFGDFPGKYSEKYDDPTNLHNTEFFKWVADSDVMLFVVDLGKLLSNLDAQRNYVAKITSAFRAEWQQYLDSNRYREKEVRRHPVIIVFNKADLFFRLSLDFDSVNEKFVSKENKESIEEVIANLGFGTEIPQLINIDEKNFLAYTQVVEKQFADLIDYFNSEVSKTQVIFTSSFGLLNNKRLGISKVFQAALNLATN